VRACRKECPDTCLIGLASVEGVKEKEYVIDLIFLSSIAICVHTSPISANNPVLDGYPPVLRGFVGGIK